MTTLQQLLEESEKKISTILEGIDCTEINSTNGWWETSTGAEFGDKKKTDVLNFQKSQLERAYQLGREDAFKFATEKLDKIIN